MSFAKRHFENWININLVIVIQRPFLHQRVCLHNSSAIYVKPWQIMLILYYIFLGFPQLNRDCHRLILGHVALTKFSNLVNVSNRDTIQQLYPALDTTANDQEEIQQRVDYKDADNIRKVLCESVI